MIESKRNMKRFGSHIRLKLIFQQFQQFQFESTSSSRSMIKASFVNDRLHFVNENFVISRKNFFNKDKRAVIAKEILIFSTKKIRHRVENFLKTILKQIFLSENRVVNYIKTQYVKDSAIVLLMMKVSQSSKSFIY